LFLRMPVFNDVVLYDMAARNVLHGGVHYRDIFDTNLPGMVWMHILVRSLLGWRSEAIRLADGVIIGVIIWLVTDWLRIQGLGRSVRVWTMALLAAFYLFTSEWCHCQRDTWMLLPALLALRLRRGQIERMTGSADHGQQATECETPCVPYHFFLVAAAEGLCWGAAFWIKPFVAIPALLCGLIGAVTVCRSRPSPGRLLALDIGGVLTGGLVAGSLGAGWLLMSGAWGPFWDLSALEPGVSPLPSRKCQPACGLPGRPSQSVEPGAYRGSARGTGGNPSLLVSA
jgi:hypothetical protein